MRLDTTSVPTPAAPEGVPWERLGEAEPLAARLRRLLPDGFPVEELAVTWPHAGIYGGSPVMALGEEGEADVEGAGPVLEAWFRHMRETLGIAVWALSATIPRAALRRPAPLPVGPLGAVVRERLWAVLPDDAYDACDGQVPLHCWLGSPDPLDPKPRRLEIQVEHDAPAGHRKIAAVRETVMPLAKVWYPGFKALVPGLERLSFSISVPRPSSLLRLQAKRATQAAEAPEDE